MKGIQGIETDQIIKGLKNKKIILNADDFGVSGFINEGIYDGIKAGVVNSVSVFVTFGDKNIRAIKKLQDKYGDRAKIGLHFTTTAGAPVYRKLEKIDFLIEPGQKKFQRLQDLDLEAYRPKFLSDELKAQIELLAKTLGGIEHIDHINNHQNLMYFHDPSWRVFLREATRHKLAIRCPRSFEMFPGNDPKKLMPIEKAGLRMGLKNLEHLKSVTILKKGAKPTNLRLKEREAKAKGVKMPNYFVSSYYGQPSKTILRRVLKKIKANHTAEFMLHLGKGTYSYNKTRYWGITRRSLKKRQQELQVLKNVGLPDLLAKHEVTLTNYSDL